MIVGPLWWLIVVPVLLGVVQLVVFSLVAVIIVVTASIIIIVVVVIAVAESHVGWLYIELLLLVVLLSRGLIGIVVTEALSLLLLRLGLGPYF